MTLIRQNGGVGENPFTLCYRLSALYAGEEGGVASGWPQISLYPHSIIKLSSQHFRNQVISLKIPFGVGGGGQIWQHQSHALHLVRGCGGVKAVTGQGTEFHTRPPGRVPGPRRHVTP